jgi:protein-S-isoprenylcysteine O-methyltransferase Ste14
MKVFFEQLVDLLHRTVTGPKSIRRVLTPLFTLFFLGINLAAIGVSFYLDRRCGFPQFVLPFVGGAAALPFLIGGGWLWLWTVWKFLKTKGTPVPVNPPPILVTDGPYAYSRNPMMAGLFLMLAGIGIFFGSVWLTFLTTPLVVIVSLIVIRGIEEPELERRFGEAYRRYRERTPILIPCIRQK